MTITAELALDRVLQRIVDLARSLVSARYAALGVPNASGSGLERFTTSGMTPEGIRRIGHLPEGKGLLGLLLREPKPIRVRRLEDDPRSAGVCDGHPQMQSFLGVPIIFRDRVTGLIALYNADTPAFTDEDARVAELFASQVAIALDNSRRVELMERQAITDELTGLYNRRAFALMGEKEVGRARRYQRPLALILFDIDHFKTVNDSHGHLIGDQVLRILTDRVTKTTRATDIVCRYGGEEFIVLMPEAGREEALAMAERLREEISRITVVTAGGTLSLTVSLGLASLGLNGDEDLDSLIVRADRAMYLAKAAGRNTVRG
ncbi:MAG: sensor domain-containing diguanylate cyclase [Candidatus Aminicenantes bacterium]|nr:sensor domain-containing diguanylate cyclase [Candidatus Aminicenantes bacterium]